MAGLTSSSLTVSFSPSAEAAVGAAVLRDRPPYPEEAEGREKRLLGLLASVVGVSEVEGRFWERNLKRLRP